MNLHPRPPLVRRAVRAAAGLLPFLLLAAVPAAFGQSSAPATLSGTVSNAATGRLLDGALVELIGTGRTTVTDAVGEFTLGDLPPGEYSLQISYLGLDAQRLTVTLGAGERVRRAVDLAASIYRLDRFTVTGEREGSAAAITRQRNAESVKHVVSMDAFGNLANDNAGELLLRLPGISGVHDLDGNISTVNIRGTPGNLNMVMVDGNLMASNFGDSRSFAFRSVSGALFDEIEVTKAPTPDMPADSIGGAINLKSASPLDLKRERRISYGASFRWAPRWVENVPMAWDHPLHPTFKFSWQQVFGVGGGERKVGLVCNAFYSENASGGHTGTNAYESTLARRAYQYDFQSRDLYNNRKQKSVSLRFDYRLSRTTRLRLSALVNQDDQPFNRQITFRATTAQSVAALNPAGQPTGTGAILPNYTETFSQARALNNSQFILTQITIGTVDNQRQFSLGAEHKFDRLELAYNAAYSRSHSVLNTGEHGDREGGGSFTQNVRNVGWAVDRGASEHYPTWWQTEGPDVSNPAVYIPGSLTRRNNRKEIDIASAKLDAKYVLPAANSAVAKAGAYFRRHELARSNRDRQWAPAAATAGVLAALVDFARTETSIEERIGRQIPFLDAADIVADVRANPARWREDLYYATTRGFIGNDRVREEIAAGYAQGQVAFGRLKSIAGLRYERTRVETAGYVASPVLSTAAQRTADPIGAARADYRTYRRSAGAYDNLFPGVYLTYGFSRNLLVRVNWSNSIGRPSFGDLVPTFSVNENTHVVTTSNAGLGPQTSRNWDAAVEYYFEPVGSVSANVFRKRMRGFLVTGNVGLVGTGAGNGFGGDYAGYDLNSTFNGGSATIEGVEFGYQQRFEFLPRPFSGLSAFASYTWLRTEGDYGEAAAAAPSTTDVVDFIPEAVNVGLAYSHRGFGARVTWNRTGRYLNSYNANPALLRYTMRREMLDASVSYQLRRGLTAFVDVRNLTNSPRAWERAAGVTTSYIFFTAVNFGIKGEF